MKIKIAAALAAALFTTPALAVEWNFYHHHPRRCSPLARRQADHRGA